MTEPERPPTLAERQAQQRAEWKAAVAGLHRAQRNGRGKRPDPEPAGYVLPPMEPAYDLVDDRELEDE
jgi:hypothetical protein